MIRNIIFDMGDVLIGFRWQDMLIEDFGVERERALKIGAEVFGDPIWAEMDAGKRQKDEVVEHYVAKYPEDGDVIRRMFDEAERMPVKRPLVWEKVKKLKAAGYKLYLLSNYSEYLFEKHTSDIPIMPLFDGKVISYREGVIKPDPEIYTIILQRYALDPKECVFFDDKKENVEAAIKLGIEGRIVTSQEQLLHDLDEFVLD